MEYRPFLSLSEDEIKEVVKDIFDPKKITCIKKHKRDDEITCNIYTEWDTDDGKGWQTVCDKITLKDPFLYGADAITADFSLDPYDFTILKQYCAAKGILPWFKDNPYLAKSKVQDSDETVQVHVKKIKKYEPQFDFEEEYKEI